MGLSPRISVPEPRRVSSMEGWIAPALRSFLATLSWPGERLIRGVASACPGTSLSAKRHIAVDSFVAASALLELLSFWAISSAAADAVRLGCVIFCIWRTVDVISSRILSVLFEKHHTSHAATFHGASNERKVILGLVNYFQLIVCFAAIYRYWPDSFSGADLVGDPLSAVYFSAITQVTIGYGDIHPVGAMRWVAVSQGISGLMLLSLFIARFLAVMAHQRQDDTK